MYVVASLRRIRNLYAFVDSMYWIVVFLPQAVVECRCFCPHSLSSKRERNFQHFFTKLNNNFYVCALFRHVNKRTESESAKKCLMPSLLPLFSHFATVCKMFGGEKASITMLKSKIEESKYFLSHTLQNILGCGKPKKRVSGYFDAKMVSETISKILYEFFKA